MQIKAPVVPISEPKPGEGGYQTFNPRPEVLSAGWQKYPTSKRLISGILIEHDATIVLRDGAKLYADIYHPAHGGTSGTVALARTQLLQSIALHFAFATQDASVDQTKPLALRFSIHRVAYCRDEDGIGWSVVDEMKSVGLEWESQQHSPAIHAFSFTAPPEYFYPCIIAVISSLPSFGHVAQPRRQPGFMTWKLD
jgi:hypothetical protein